MMAYAGFFQAEDGIRDSPEGLEFR
eukprot:COSAG05_NODE_10372_length_569_cov_0.493617_2_plen_24_part_01